MKRFEVIFDEAHAIPSLTTTYVYLFTFVYICVDNISKQISIKVMVSDETHPLKIISTTYMYVYILLTKRTRSKIF